MNFACLSTRFFNPKQAKLFLIFHQKKVTIVTPIVNNSANPFRVFVLTALAVLVLASSAFAIEDTIPNRQRETARYLAVVPIKQMYEDSVAHSALELPMAERKEFVREAMKMLDEAALKKALRDSMMKCLTADEIGALADFYSTNLGWSAMVKIGPCSNAVMTKLLMERLEPR